MLLNLQVKNLALIESAEIEFGSGLNILTGETGAGKSLLMGSVNLALGGKAGADLIGKYSDSAFVELNFSVDEEKAKLLEEMDVYPEDGVVTISRRITGTRSPIKVNSETMKAENVRMITSLLIDIHGQHDHQSLLYKSNHIKILDKFAAKPLSEVKPDCEKAYKAYKAALAKLDEFDISEEERNRNISFLQFEIDEIDSANIHIGEDEELEKEYRCMSNYRKIAESLGAISELMGNDSDEGASDRCGRACQLMSSCVQYDEGLKSLYEQLADIDNLVGDFTRDLADHMADMEFDEKVFYDTESRLDLLNGLKAKHGGSLEAVLEYYDKANEKLAFYEDYEASLMKAKNDADNARTELVKLCDKISAIRQKEAKVLSSSIKDALKDLNFEHVEFEIEVRALAEPTANGMDEAQFMISLNPGEELRPLDKIASGGELSRIMLGIKSVLAGKDDIGCLIFDEIDTGISGRTAQKVSEKMALIAKDHQVICITHLPQIAAMADNNYLIEKSSDETSTRTSVKKLDEDGVVSELARMLGGSEITGLTFESAKQMREQAKNLF